MEKTPFLNPADFLEDETFLISFNIALICQRICDVQTRILKKYDLTPRQSLVLAYLRNHADEKVTQKVLEDKMHLSNPTVTVIIQSMIGKGLIVKEKDTEDRRKYILHVTEKGKMHSAAVMANPEQRMTGSMKAFPGRTLIISNP